jgi:hypothetical protein
VVDHKPSKHCSGAQTFSKRKNFFGALFQKRTARFFFYLGKDFEKSKFLRIHIRVLYFVRHKKSSSRVASTRTVACAGDRFKKYA